MSQIKEQIAADELVRQRMQKLLRWDEFQLNQCEYEQGVAWLDATFGRADGQDFATVRQRLEAAKGFWAWWKNQWRRLDALLSPNLRAAQVGDSWLLGYYAPGIGPTFFARLEPWQAFYQDRHRQDMKPLRPDDEVLRRILKAV